MKNFFLLILLMPLLDVSGCQTPTQEMDEFWPVFKKAVAKDNRERVAALTNFPLPGAEPFVQSSVYVAAGILPEQFLASYDRIFDERTRSTIARTKAKNLVNYTVEADSYPEELGIPLGTEVYRLTVRYVFNEGQENQTESTVSFHFIRIQNTFLLGFLELGG